MMIDTHCHIDLYPRPTDVADRADRAGVLTVIVTNLPSAFDRAYAHVRQFKNMRLAVGLHPLAAREHVSERRRFTELVDKTSYIGEVGLDFSREGVETKDIQMESFRFVLRTLRGKQKFITLHSRRAEAEVLDILEDEGQAPVVFHWYSGSLVNLKRALDLGHFFSVNPAMFDSPNGRKIIASLPKERVLTESDGPFVKVRGRAAVPADVGLAEEGLASLWKLEKREVTAKIRGNFMELTRPLRKNTQPTT